MYAAADHMGASSLAEEEVGVLWSLLLGGLVSFSLVLLRYLITCLKNSFSCEAANELTGHTVRVSPAYYV